MTKLGEKREDYRDINSYWFCRLFSDYNFNFPSDAQTINELIKLLNTPKQGFGIKELRDNFFVPNKFISNVLTLGYPKGGDTSRILEFEHLGIDIWEGKQEWGAEPGKRYFVIMHGSALNDH